jgi:uncharacterized protein YdeI (YjbR/CyaY-like superfamily)
VRYKKDSGVPCVTYVEIVEEALCFGFIDSKPNVFDPEFSVIYVCERKLKSVWSNTNKIRVERLIKEKLMTPAGLEKIKIAKQNDSWDAITSSQNYEMPSGLTKALAKNKPAKKYIELFPPGVKRQIYQWIELAKTEETKNKRIHETVSLTEKNIRANQFVKKYFFYHPRIHAKIKGATMVASLSTINFGVEISSFPQVIFSLGTAPL